MSDKRLRETSRAVYNEIKDNGLLSRMRWIIYDCLYHNGPLTAQEVFKELRCETNQSGRFTEMRELGVIQECGTRECTVTGREVISWDVTDKLPLAQDIPKLLRPSRADMRDAGMRLFDIIGQDQWTDGLRRVVRWLVVQ